MPKLKKFDQSHFKIVKAKQKQGWKRERIAIHVGFGKETVRKAMIAKTWPVFRRNAIAEQRAKRQRREDRIGKDGVAAGRELVARKIRDFEKRPPKTTILDEPDNMPFIADDLHKPITKTAGQDVRTRYEKARDLAKSYFAKFRQLANW